MVHSAAPIPSFADAIKFHGHKCPGLALGYRAAVIALEELRTDPSRDEELVAIVENDACGIDALQVVTGCTAGKGNLVFRDYGKHVYTLINRKNNYAIRVATKPDFSTSSLDPVFGNLRNKVMGGKATDKETEAYEKHLDNVCNLILTVPYGDIFSVRRVDEKVPEEATIYKSVPCECCGELVSEHRVRIVDGKHLCIPCSLKNDR
ncbi:MAG TPA: FmdE family protein [Methanoregulaceae archaeon]|nr:FmdE family protein [Methanoregulaceae archaeon]